MPILNWGSFMLICSLNSAYLGLARSNSFSSVDEHDYNSSNTVYSYSTSSASLFSFLLISTYTAISNLRITLSPTLTLPPLCHYGSCTQNHVIHCLLLPHLPIPHFLLQLLLEQHPLVLNPHHHYLLFLRQHHYYL